MKWLPDPEGLQQCMLPFIVSQIELNLKWLPDPEGLQPFKSQVPHLTEIHLKWLPDPEGLQPTLIVK